MRESSIARWLVPRVVDMRIDWPLVLLDAAVVALAYVGMAFLRFEGRMPVDLVRSLTVALPVIVGVHVGTNAVTGLYGRVWTQASVEEARRLVTAGLVAGVLVLGLVVAGHLELSLLTAVSGSGLSLLLIGGSRFQARVFSFHRRGEVGDTSTQHRAVLVGADSTARVLLHSLRERPAATILPVAVVDENSRMHGRTLVDLPILGGLDAIRTAAALHEATMVIIASPEVRGSSVAEIVKIARELGLELKVLPSWPELLGPDATAHDLRDLDISDLLGRQQIATDLTGVRDMLAGRRVLITGGGGSIGSEIARQVATFDPASLVLLDNDETHLHDALHDLPDGTEQVLADIRDRRRIERVFDRWRPEIVFHAAAHKHVPVLEAHPCEGIATNVLGSQNVIRAAVACGVQRFVFISTDKAVGPVNVMGATKRVGEQLLLTACPPGVAFSVVRFGNVLGSRGSVVPAFLRQIRGGGPLTVTHPDVERFFMSIPEAVHLVLHAAAQSDGGDLFMLDMGAPVRILDLAERMLELSRRPHLDIQFIGLRPGEKLSEELSEPEEERTPTEHPSVHRLAPIVADRTFLLGTVARLEELVRAQADQAASELLFQLVAALRTETAAVATHSVDRSATHRPAVTRSSVIRTQTTAAPGAS